MKSLVDQLEAAGKLDDTVIVLSADHYPYGLTDEEYSELLGHTVDPVFEIYENTLILWNDQMKKPVEVDKYWLQPGHRAHSVQPVRLGV